MIFLTMKNIQNITLCILSILLLSLSGCDWTARWDLRQADKALKEADLHHAEVWAEKEYRKAQAAFIEALDYNKVRLINECRDKCAETRMWAEEATALAIQRFEEMQEEKARIGEYKL